MQSPTPYSVVIPFYRDERYFTAALSSIRRQTVQPEQVIVVVDGEENGSEAFFAGFDGLEVSYLPTNEGSAVARNAGIERAWAPVVAFLDADDVWLPDKMERQLAFLRDHPGHAACHTGVLVVDGDGDVTACYTDKPPRLELAHLLRGNQVLTSSLVIRRDALLDAGCFDRRYRTSQDFELILRLVKRGAVIGFLPAPLTQLRRAGHGNVSSRGALLLKNHARIAWHYRRDLMRVGGVAGYLRFIAKYLSEDGSRMRGPLGRLVYALGVTFAGLLGGTRS